MKHQSRRTTRRTVAARRQHCSRLLVEPECRTGKTKAPKQVQYLARFRDWLADITKPVGGSVELGAIVSDGEVPLVQIAEFRLI
jgi:hypothetical protein